MSQNVSYLAGTTLGGVLAAGPGPEYVYGLDTVTFAVSFCILWLVRPLPVPDAEGQPVRAAIYNPAGTGRVQLVPHGGVKDSCQPT